MSLVFFHDRGETAEAMASRFPPLPRELINWTIAFYKANKNEVNAYVAACQAEIDRQRGGSIGTESLGTEEKKEGNGAEIRAMNRPPAFLLDEHLRGPLWEGSSGSQRKTGCRADLGLSSGRSAGSTFGNR